LKKENNDDIRLYGNIPWKEDANAEIQVTDRYRQNYACWFSPPGIKAGIPAAIIGALIILLMELFEKKRCDIMCLKEGQRSANE